MVDKSINQRQPVCCKNRNEMLERFLTDDSLNDVVLKGTDGVEVPANRFLLAARSDVFKGMLLGKFQESSLPVVDLSFSGSVLKAVVEFVLTDSAQILKFNKRKAPDGEENDVPTHQIESLVSLAVAASYFNLGGLGVLVLECFEKSLLAKQPCASFAILHACRMAGNAVPEALQLKAKDWSGNCFGFLNSGGILTPIKERNQQQACPSTYLLKKLNPNI
ncbi:expressed unknown protein [Seminavis robusta]|uniref:BTB domain-containing protein n=1 Tax=Seminavis robusta TaxID=568900 RepID=A0A9N8DQM0_9STRA|nr:expressed unknown protein [Seminavis robusta]|eukprot:Sro285_g108130.1 n/a (220) ;mRNA; r:42389-43157